MTNHGQAEVNIPKYSKACSQSMFVVIIAKHVRCDSFKDSVCCESHILVMESSVASGLDFLLAACHPSQMAAEASVEMPQRWLAYGTSEALLELLAAPLHMIASCGYLQDRSCAALARQR